MSSENINAKRNLQTKLTLLQEDMCYEYLKTRLPYVHINHTDLYDNPYKVMLKIKTHIFLIEQRQGQLSYGM